MRKLFLPILILLCCSFASVQAQLTPAQTRDAQWKSYVLPQANFARQMSPEKEFLFRVPADWQQQGTELVFKGPHSSFIRVFTQKVPDGYPFQDYFASVLNGVRALNGTEAPLTRKTQLQDLEAREIFLDVPNTDGEVIHITTWITVTGPLAVTFNFQAPIAHASEVEPFFKAVVQSVQFVPQRYHGFESLRASIIKTPAPGPIDEIESIVATLNQALPDRESSINRLASLFATHTDVAIDLLLDRRPLVRAAAVQALARTNNAELKPFLWEFVGDDEALVAEPAARTVATTPDVVPQLLKHSISGYRTELIARVWPFMAAEKQIELLQRIFEKAAVTPDKVSLPPAARTPPKNGVSVTIESLAPVKPGAPVPDVTVGVSDDPIVQAGALTLLNSLTPDEFKLPLPKLIASKYNPLIAAGLETANYRGEALPLDSLLKLVASPDQQVSKLAAENLGFSASVADIPRIEALVSKDSAADKKALDDELKLSIGKIRFRNDLSAAKTATEQREIIGKALSDQSLDEFAWRYACEATTAGCGPKQIELKRDFTVKPFAENLLPRNLIHYTAIPNPAQTVQRIYETLHGLQMDSPRAQAGLVLMLSYWRQTFANELSAPADAATLIEYTGIDPNAPIAMGSWISDQALDTTSSATRHAMLFRVKDRERFERSLQKLLGSGSGMRELTDYFAIGTRAVAALPAILPLSMQLVAQRDANKKPDRAKLEYNFVSEKEWNGLRIKTFEYRTITSKWQTRGTTTCLVFIGDTAILAPDIATIRDLLTHVNQNERQFLADNAEFRKAIERGGDVVYFSDVKAVMAGVGEKAKDIDYHVKESGELNIGNASWENSHHLTFDESDWARPMLSFRPKELTAPRDLLPASTIAYYFMHLDAALAWSSNVRKNLFPDDTTSDLWALDFKQQVLPELGPECGAALLDLPNFEDYTKTTGALFCKLKSVKLADALSAGTLFKGVGPAKDLAQVKSGTDTFFVAARNGFLVVSNRENGLTALDGKTHLADTRDYSRAVEKVPGSVVAFGGYNLEAALAAANKTPVEGANEAQIASLIGAVTSAFHSQHFFATATAGAVEAHSSVAMDREGRYAVADFTTLPGGMNITFVAVEPTGVPITDQSRLSSLVLKLRSKAPGPIDNIRDDVKVAGQTVEQKSPKELVLTVPARRNAPDKAIELPVKDAELAAFVKATTEFPAEDQQIKEQAQRIAGTDKDAWRVARKLAEWTNKNLEWKHVASADPALTLATREADCSEFSALFVAMARSLGLPARTVSGLAYSGNSFGGHEWVEVWVGKWIELDPTWGTDFVDATHIRDNSNALLTSAALNLIDVEVVETNRAVAEFQKTAKGLTEHLLKAIPSASQADMEAAIDLPVLTDALMGAGAWSRMSDGEKEKMWSAYRRVLGELRAYGSESNRMRVVHLEEKGNEAEAICILSPSDLLLKLRLVRQNERWYLIEVTQSDTTLMTLKETLQPTIAAIENARAGQKGPVSAVSDFVRVLLLMNQDPAKGIVAADEALKNKAGDKGLRFLKALALSHASKMDDAIKLLRELSDEDFAPAVRELSEALKTTDDPKAWDEVISTLERYTKLEPYDARGFHWLADAYYGLDTPENLVKAEAAYRKALELSPADAERYIDLIFFLAENERFAEIGPLLTLADQRKDTNQDVLGSLLRHLYSNDESEFALKVAANEPARMKASLQGNLIIARIHMDEGRYVTALNHLNVAAQIDKTSSSPYVVMSEVYRKQSRWTAALRAADQAIGLDAQDGEAHYERACSLARLGRTKEAISTLEKAIELYPDQASSIAYEKDLKPLASLPAFKKLIPPEQ